MAGIIDKTRDALGEHLQPGEEVLAAAKAQVEGNTMKMARQRGFQQNLGFIATEVLERRGLSEAPDVDFSNGAVVAATDRRFLLMNVTNLGANPKELVAAYDLGQIVGVETGTKRVMLVKMLTVTVSLQAQEGPPADLSFEFPKVATKDAENLVTVLRTRKP